MLENNSKYWKKWYSKFENCEQKNPIKNTAGARGVARKAKEMQFKSQRAAEAAARRQERAATEAAADAALAEVAAARAAPDVPLNAARLKLQGAILCFLF